MAPSARIPPDWRKRSAPERLVILGLLAVVCIPLASCIKNSTSTNSLPMPAFGLTPRADGFSHPLDLQAPDDNTGRLFVVEQGGRIRILRPNGPVDPDPFLDIGGKLSSDAGEEGLLGLAFHPQFATNRRFFVNYTSGTGGLHTVISEFTASTGDPDRADPASERILLTVDQPYHNHNGGGLAFGTDGYLYIALGDGGSGGDPQGNGQNLDTLLGKILRIDVNSAPSPGLPYAIPADNPFVNKTGRDEIWLYGLRNPFRFSIDHATGDLWIGDVGQDQIEELDRIEPQQAGANLGWNIMEGSHCFNPSTACLTVGLTLPIFDYSHAQGDKTVIGGYVYHGIRLPHLAGAYIFGDFISGRIWTLDRNAAGQWIRTAILTTGANDLSSFGQDREGELYVVRYSSGVVSRIDPGDPPQMQTP